MNWLQIDPVLRVWLTFWFNRALGVVGPGLAAVGITTNGDTAALMAGVAITALHFLVAYLNTRAALNAPASASSTTPKTLTPGISLGVDLKDK